MSQHPTSKPDLAYIALTSRDTERTAKFLGNDLELPNFVVSAPTGDDVPAFRVGDTALALFPENHDFITNPKPGVDHIAFATPDPMAQRVASGLTSEKIDTSGLNGATQVAIDRTDTCGVNVRLTPALPLPSTQSPLVLRIDHLGIASADNAAAEAVFCGNLGAVYESRQTDMEVSTALESFTSDKYGAIYHTRKPETVGGLRVSFLTVGDLDLEFLQNYDPTQGFEIKHGTAVTPNRTKAPSAALSKAAAAACTTSPSKLAISTRYSPAWPTTDTR